MIFMVILYFVRRKSRIIAGSLDRDGLMMDNPFIRAEGLRCYIY